MAVPTHSNNKSTSVENMGVPVLFSIKNVQPLILAAKPTADIGALQSSAPTHPPITSSSQGTAAEVVSPTVGVVDSQSKARRAGLLSKAVATTFVVMLVVVVIRFSIPGSKNSSDVADSVEPKNNGVSEAVVTSVVTGPESNTESEGTYVASRPIAPELDLGAVANNSTVTSPNIPVLPPLLSVSSTKESAANHFAAPSPISIQPPVITQGAPLAPNSNNNASVEPSEIQSLEIPSSTPMIDLSQSLISNQTDGSNLVQQSNRDQEASGTTDNLHILETLTPDRSLADFEWLFRNATKNPLIPYRPVSTGGQDSGLGQQMVLGSPPAPSSGFGTSSGTDKNVTPSGPTTYQPLTIPSSDAVPPYEKNLPNASVNRYQPRIKQPQRQTLPSTPEAEKSTTPAPYQPIMVPNAPQPGASGTSFGYPPVQYSPATNGATQNSSVQNIPGQR